MARAKQSSTQALVIVESPAKAKTINRYLGSGYKVMASRCNVRALPPVARAGNVQKELELE